MMIAIVIGIILSIGLIQVMVAGKTAAQATQGANFMQENARFAVSQLSYSLQMADHWGPSNPDKGQTTAAAQTAFNAIVASCPNLVSTSTTMYVTGQNWWTLGTYGIDGAVDPATVLGAGCLPDWVAGDGRDRPALRGQQFHSVHRCGMHDDESCRCRRRTLRTYGGRQRHGIGDRRRNYKSFDGNICDASRCGLFRESRSCQSRRFVYFSVSD